jgi:hypothetical protein
VLASQPEILRAVHGRGVYSERSTAVICIEDTAELEDPGAPKNVLGGVVVVSVSQSSFVNRYFVAVLALINPNISSSSLMLMEIEMCLTISGAALSAALWFETMTLRMSRQVRRGIGRGTFPFFKVSSSMRRYVYIERNGDNQRVMDSGEISSDPA